MILLIEDHDDLREALACALEVEGHAVVTARDGNEGLHLLAEGLEPRMIILDLMMPGRDGWSFRAEQTADARWAEIPTILYSGAAINQAAVRALGVRGYAAKPDVDGLLKLVALVAAG